MIVDKELRQFLKDNNSSLDDIQEHIWDIIVLNQLSNQEVAAVFTSLMRDVLSQEHNAKLLGDIGISIEQLNPHLTTDIQQILTEEWLIDNGFIK